MKVDKATGVTRPADELVLDESTSGGKLIAGLALDHGSKGLALDVVMPTFEDCGTASCPTTLKKLLSTQLFSVS